MTKCTQCNQAKAKRNCPTLSVMICPKCCGSKRGREIECVDFCEYFISLDVFEKQQALKNVNSLVSSHFNNINEDVFRDPDFMPFALELESYFVELFHNDDTITDDDIYEIVAIIYAYQSQMIKDYGEMNDLGTAICKKYEEVDKQITYIKKEEKLLIVLRILKSIRSISGGEYGNRNYLRVVAGQIKNR